MIPFLEFKAQFRAIEDEVRAAVNEVLESGWYVLGKQLEAFEKAFADYLGVRHVVGVASGTDAIHLALRAAGVAPGGEVLSVANTCVPTVAAICAASAKPRLVDVSPETLTMDAAKLDAAIGRQTQAILPVHLYGHPCDMDPILEVARAHNIPVIEDCAQAHGAEYRGRRCGTFGLAAAFSFYPTKNLGAYGDAGAVATDDDDVAQRLRQLRNYGEDRRYYHGCQGFNSRLDEMQAAVLRVKLRHLDDWTQARRKRAQAYRERLANTPLLLPPDAEWARQNYHLFAVRSPERDAIAAHLKRADIGVLMHYPVPIHLQPGYADLGYAQGAFPVAERACNEVFSLPLYPELSFEDLGRVCQALGGYFEKA